MRFTLKTILLLTYLLNPTLGELLPIQVTTISNLQLQANSITTGVSGNLIVTEKSAIWDVNIKSNPPTKQLIAGSTTSGYIEGTGADARFSYLPDVVLMNQTHILVTDSKNHCLRIVDLLRKQTMPYAGLCLQRKFIDGYRLDARFNMPTGMWKMTDVVYISDVENRAVRSLGADQVDTVCEIDEYVDPNYIAGLADGLIYLTVANGVLEIQTNNNNSLNSQLLSGAKSEGFWDGTLSSSRYWSPKGIVMLNEQLLIVADFRNNHLRIVDKFNNSVTSICSGAKESLDGNSTLCGFKTIWNLHVYEDKILIADDNHIRYLPLYSLIEEPPLTPTTPSAANPTTQSTTLCILFATSIRYLL